jgi:hypothetical protein
MVDETIVCQHCDLLSVSAWMGGAVEERVAHVNGCRGRITPRVPISYLCYSTGHGVTQ